MTSVTCRPGGRKNTEHWLIHSGPDFFPTLERSFPSHTSLPGRAPTHFHIKKTYTQTQCLLFFIRLKGTAVVLRTAPPPRLVSNRKRNINRKQHRLLLL